MHKIRLGLVMALAFVATFTEAARAADPYPDRPVKLIVPFGAGSTTDVLARFIGNGLSERLKQPFVVVNKPGGYGLIACQEVAKSAADGYTLGVLPDGPMATIPSAFAALDKTPICKPSDVRPIALMADIPFLVVVRSDVPVKTLDELVTYLKEHPGGLRFAAPHPTGTLGIALLETYGARADRIPYTTEPDAWAQGMLTGSVQGMFSTLYTSIQQIRDGKARALAVLAPSRLEELPNVPTAAEAGYPGLYVFPTWIGLFGQNGAPADRIATIERTVTDILKDPATAKKVRDIMLVPHFLSHEPLGRMVKQQNEDMTRFIRDRKMTNLVGN